MKKNKIFDWMHVNLFSSPLNIFITLTFLLLTIYVVPPVFKWAISSADWVGDTSAHCSKEGACWVFIKVRIKQICYGFYPQSEIWRVNIFLAALGMTFFSWAKVKRHQFKLVFIWTYFILPLLGYILLFGYKNILPTVPTDQWGGVFLTLIIASIGILSSLPLGALLALGRQSPLPFVKSTCVLFIEFCRGVPLITILFMSSVMFPLFLPNGWNPDKLLRALTGVALFASAYMAEVIRGGLQAMPKGQYEAGKALGLNYWQLTSLIILPQALRLVIPGIVNTFIGLFKDTSLVAIIGMYDFMGVMHTATADTEWLGFATEAYVFAGIFYWMICFAMSRYSLAVEAKLNRSTQS